MNRKRNGLRLFAIALFVSREEQHVSVLAPGASRFSGGAEDSVELFFVHHFDAIVVEEEPTVVVFRETHVVTVIWTRSYVHYDCEKIVTSLVGMFIDHVWNLQFG